MTCCVHVVSVTFTCAEEQEVKLDSLSCALLLGICSQGSLGLVFLSCVELSEPARTVSASGFLGLSDSVAFSFLSGFYVFARKKKVLTKPLCYDVGMLSGAQY